MKHKTKILIIMMSAAALKTNGQIPAHWAQYTVEDTVNIPADEFWDAFFKLNLEDVASVGNYKDLPKIVKTTPSRAIFQNWAIADVFISTQVKRYWNRSLNGINPEVFLMNSQKWRLN
ncbi:MAG: hypothetical protein WBP58_15425 [Chitinophagaceae bacterium]